MLSASNEVECRCKPQKLWWCLERSETWILSSVKFRKDLTNISVKPRPSKAFRQDNCKLLSVSGRTYPLELHTIGTTIDLEKALVTIHPTMQSLIPTGNCIERIHELEDKGESILNIWQFTTFFCNIIRRAVVNLTYFSFE